MRYFIHIAYAGTHYHGWQKQPNAPTVQETLDHALGLIAGIQPLETVGCGRTDTGVHASSFYLHADLPGLKLTPAELTFKLNRLLPADIAVHNIIPVHETAHARFDATQRQYQYCVHHHKNPFIDKTSVYLHKVPDYDAMNNAAERLLKHSDFASFCKANAGSHTTLCKVSEAVWKPRAEGHTFYIAADRFLRNMVRAIVGTLFEVGLGNMTADEFDEVIKSGNRANAGESVAAHGLCLTAVHYPYIS